MPNLESNTQHDLGSVIARHRVSKSVSNYIPSGAVLFLLAFGVIVLLTSKDILSLFICVLPPGLALCVLVWNLITGRGEELTVYENGFTYKTKTELARCLWDEIEDYSTTRVGHALTGIKKSDGNWINFAVDMQGLDDLQPHLRTSV